MGGQSHPKTIDPVVERLRKRRLELGLSQTELAKLSGTQQSAISAMETGDSSPTIGTLRRIARALNVEIEARDLIHASVEKEIMYLNSLSVDALERELLRRRWYVHLDDLIGAGYCIMPVDAPPSSGCSPIADFTNELAAEHIALLHNSMVDRPVYEPPPDDRDPHCVEQWPHCFSGGYDPRCCRFPKSCSA